ncbi:MAG TPA: NADH-quinone oxidoreductase subunit A [Chthoniobacteraceae bacterium]|nr:NADH-quinone oxidoreductase subunit A [Chthoniobacteraceae bacterium]
MNNQYLAILIHAIVAVGFAASALIVSVLLGKAGKRNKTKDSAYECGMLPEGGAQPRFSVKFYLVAMLFILFDIEIVFMYPWAVVYRDFLAKAPGAAGANGLKVLLSMFSFIGILTAGYFYALKKGALDWKK